jgi:hypothetical protein
MSPPAHQAGLAHRHGEGQPASQIELLDVHGPLESLEALQAALDARREEYSTDRPHRSLAIAFPAAGFTMADASALELSGPTLLGATPAACRSTYKAYATRPRHSL